MIVLFSIEILLFQKKVHFAYWQNVLFSNIIIFIVYLLAIQSDHNTLLLIIYT